MVVEVVKSDVHWSEPRDRRLDEQSPVVNGGKKRGIASNHGSGANVLYASGRVEFLPSNSKPETVKQLLTFVRYPRLIRRIDCVTILHHVLWCFESPLRRGLL